MVIETAYGELPAVDPESIPDQLGLGFDAPVDSITLDDFSIVSSSDKVSVIRWHAGWVEDITSEYMGEVQIKSNDAPVGTQIQLFFRNQLVLTATKTIA